MPTITDWIMVGITFLYMLFTIGIFIANLRSSESAKSQLEETKKQMEESKNQFEKQLAETKHQYEETKRLEALPFLQIDTATRNDSRLSVELSLFSGEGDRNGYVNDIQFEVKNIGRGTVKDILFDWQNLKGHKTEKQWFPIRSLTSGDKETVKYTFLSSNNTKNTTAVFNFYYTDLFENWYKQKVVFLFLERDGFVYPTYISHDSFPPVLLEEESKQALISIQQGVNNA